MLICIIISRALACSVVIITRNIPAIFGLHLIRKTDPLEKSMGVKYRRKESVR